MSDARDAVEHSEAYRKRREHRDVCPQWQAGKHCMECGFGLVDFASEVLVELGIERRFLQVRNALTFIKEHTTNEEVIDLCEDTLSAVRGLAP